MIFLYRSQSYTGIENDIVISFLREFLIDRELIILTDFNLPSLQWTSLDSWSNYFKPVDSVRKKNFFQIKTYPSSYALSFFKGFIRYQFIPWKTNATNGAKMIAAVL